MDRSGAGFKHESVHSRKKERMPSFPLSVPSLAAAPFFNLYAQSLSVPRTDGGRQSASQIAHGRESTESSRVERGEKAFEHTFLARLSHARRSFV